MYSCAKFKVALSALALMTSASAIAQTDITIDAAAHCLDTDLMEGSRAVGSLPPGKYRASLIDNTMRCDGDSPDQRCAINTVVVRGIDFSKKAGTMLWGVAIKKAATVEVLGNNPADLSAFVLDNGCSDNVGSATLRFVPLN